MHPYAGADAALATMHGKHAALSPALAARLGMRLVLASAVDTDALGTFTGEIARRGSMLEAAVAKARLGMRATGLRLGIASEGSFGPHPAVPFLPLAIELVVLVDDARGLVIHEQTASERTNYAHCTARHVEDLGPLLDRVRFPSHALVVRPNAGDGAIVKGITDRDRLGAAIAAAAAASADGAARVETDMRAHLNPTRMGEIAKLADRFADRLAALCPACHTPGFGIIRSEPGLPCEACGAPTALVRTLVRGCVRCALTVNEPRSDGLRLASAAQCPECNP
ncbi:MAG: DUF6671 family protein [Hyphomicrobiales bacterium]